MKDGDRIERIYWSPKPDGRQESLCETPMQTLHYESAHYHESSTDWVVLKRDGIEAARHNVRHIESIIWKP